jgi:hypothetical protein
MASTVAGTQPGPTAPAQYRPDRFRLRRLEVPAGPWRVAGNPGRNPCVGGRLHRNLVVLEEKLGTMRVAFQAS